jgi:cellulose 1,4-beta-cellobiosidase
MIALSGFLAAKGSLRFRDASATTASATTLCSEQTASVDGGTYIVQNNEYDSSASECVSTDGGADFTVANSAIDNATDGSPGAYPSIYQGCHWGNCSSGGLTSAPVLVSDLTPGTVTSSWSTTQPGTGTYDVAYDIWFNQTPTTDTQPDCTELMVWLNHNGSVQPFGSEIASGVTVGGYSYNIWEGQQSTWNTISYEMNTGTTSVSNLDIGTLAQDAVSRGYLSDSCYLIDVEAGFELWQGGAGLATNSFSVTTGSGSTASSSPSPSPSSSLSTSSSPTPTSGSAGSCSAASSVVSSWQGGYQGQVTLTNDGSSAINGWTAAWTSPTGQEISDLWNGVVTQSGTNVSVTNASYNASIAPGGSVTLGFIATDSGTATAPSGVILNGSTCS